MESNLGRSAYLTSLTAGPNRLSAWKCGCKMYKMGAISLWDDREAMADELMLNVLRCHLTY